MSYIRMSDLANYIEGEQDFYDMFAPSDMDQGVAPPDTEYAGSDATMGDLGQTSVFGLSVPAWAPWAAAAAAVTAGGGLAWWLHTRKQPA